MRSHQSLAKGGPGNPKPKKPNPFKPQPMLAANKAINSFAPNGLFHATDIAATSGRRSVNQMIKDSHINKK